MLRFSRRRGLKMAFATLAGAPLLLAGTRSAQAAAHQVTISGFAFNPPVLNVAAGDTVVFSNNDPAPHTATANDGSFDTGRINPGNSAQVTISTAGSVSYKCNFHPSMKGTISAS